MQTFFSEMCYIHDQVLHLPFPWTASICTQHSGLQESSVVSGLLVIHEAQGKLLQLFHHWLCSLAFIVIWLCEAENGDRIRNTSEDPAWNIFRRKLAAGITLMLVVSMYILCNCPRIDFLQRKNASHPHQWHVKLSLKRRWESHGLTAGCQHFT